MACTPLRLPSPEEDPARKPFKLVEVSYVVQSVVGFEAVTLQEGQGGKSCVSAKPRALRVLLRLS